jgi:hypothetical protein
MEPERPIEKLLRAFAKKRRDEAGAPLELHGATRRLLQAEVARRKPKSQPEGGFFPGLLRLLRPQLAFGLCIIAVLVVGAVMILPLFNRGKTESQLAQVPAATEERLGIDNLATAPPPAAAPATVAAEEAPADLARSQVRFDQPSADKKNDLALRDDARRYEPAVTAVKSLASESVTNAVGQGVQLYAEAGAAGRKLMEEERSPALAEVDAYKAKANFNESVSRKNSPQAPAENRLRASTPSLSKAQEPKRELALSESLADETKRQPNDTVTLAQRAPASAPASFGVALQPAPVPTAPEGRASVAGGSRNVTTQSFAQVIDGTKTKDVNGNLVLNSFRVEQTGNEIRFVDADGSTYAGFLQSQDTPARPVEGQRSATVSSRAIRPTQTTRRSVTPQNEVSAVQAQRYFFRVTGTNRSLNQPVIFTGDLIAATNAMVVSTNAPIVSSAAGLPVANPNLEPLPLFNSRISGKARVGERDELQINAVPSNTASPSKQ